jgi:hypothetical protein
MLVYVKKAPLIIEPEPKEVRDERYRQFDALQDFIRFAFRDEADGTFAIASNSFTELALFEELIGKGLRRSILDRIPLGEVDATLPPANASCFGLGVISRCLSPQAFAWYLQQTTMDG